MLIIGDLIKMLTNYLKHGVSFIEAEECIWSNETIFKEDAKHSQDERRFNLISMSPKGRILFIVFCKREHGLKTRIISARLANDRERKEFEDTYGKNAVFKSVKNKQGKLLIRQAD